MNKHGFVRITCVSPEVVVADPEANVTEMVRLLQTVPESDIVLFPELGITGYTCGDLFGQTALLSAAERELKRLVAATAGTKQLVVAGLPVPLGSRLYNCAVVIQDGSALGIVPKQHLPNYREFYESRWFSRGDEEIARSIQFAGEEQVPFGIDLLFDAGSGATVGIEVCEDLWVPVPPSSIQALAGATILLNLSASNETIGKSHYRSELVTGQSGRCVAAYAYSSSGPSESSTDLVFGGHCLIAENGQLLAESNRVGDGTAFWNKARLITADVDVQKLATDRRALTTFGQGRTGGADFRRVPFAIRQEMEGLKRFVSGQPFVPGEGQELSRRCAEIFGIQCAALAKRLSQLPERTPLNVGISGGLDSTLALLVAVKTCDMMERDRRLVHGLTMPGFGTTDRTLRNALALMDLMGVTAERLDISELALSVFQRIGHRPFGIDCRGMHLPMFLEALEGLPAEAKRDLVFENVQARLRTFLLMSRGFVIGTGDMSELALGWCTYNGDHMSMYNPNCSIPKTLVKFLVSHVARAEFPEGPIRETLLSISQTTISPELLPPGRGGEAGQSTELEIGPYELHDFFLFQMVRCGFDRRKILFLSEHAQFSKTYSPDEVKRTLDTFYRRFFAQQYKRSCVPDGPKVGSVCLSPRGDWRMPSDASAAAWLASEENTAFNDQDA